MNKRSLYFIIFTMIAAVSIAQQKPGKHLSFCGWKYTDTNLIRLQYQRQLDFLRINDHDTIVDIGSSSGSFEGCLSVIGDFKKVNFVLVDIDSNCLNTTKVNNMVIDYSRLKGEPLDQQFFIVHNTTDSLYLPGNSYTKAWIMNTLHEIPDKQKMIKDICNILKTGGELVLLELAARPKHIIHGGCHQPLMDESEIKNLFEANGFKQVASLLWDPTSPKKSPNPFYMVRFEKI